MALAGGICDPLDTCSSISMKFHENILNSFQTKLPVKFQRGITKKMYRQELRFLCCEHPLMMFYISMKFRENILFVFVLRFYGPVNPMGSCRAQSVYLTTRLLGRLSPLSG